MAANGLITLSSPHAPDVTLDRLAVEIMARGLKIFAQIDHAAEAVAAGLTLRPTALVIFGSGKGGTPLMQAAQTIGIDLPLKVLVWQDAAGATWLSYNDPAWIAERHGLGAELAPVVNALSGLLQAVMAAATAP